MHIPVRVIVCAHPTRRPDAGVSKGEAAKAALQAVTNALKDAQVRGFQHDASERLSFSLIHVSVAYTLIAGEL